MRGLHALLPLGVYPNMAGAASAAPPTLTNDARNTVIYGYIHDVVTYWASVNLSRSIGLNKGDVDCVLKSIHGPIIPVVEFP